MKFWTTESLHRVNLSLALVLLIEPSQADDTKWRIVAHFTGLSIILRDGFESQSAADEYMAHITSYCCDECCDDIEV